MEDRKQFTFYASFFEAAQTLQSPEERAALYEAVCAYALYGEERKLTGTAAGMFAIIRPILISSRNKAQNRLGKKQSNNKTTTNQNQTDEKNKSKNKSKCKSKSKCKNKYLIGGVGESPTPDKPTRARFVPPDEAELIAFFREAGSDKAEAEAFRDYYEANGWKVGKNSMKDWKAAARGWIRRSGQYGQAKPAGNAPSAWDALDKAAERIERGDFTFMEV